LVVAMVVVGCGLHTVVPHVLVAIHVDMIFMAATRAFKEASMTIASVKDVLGDGILIMEGPTVTEPRNLRASPC